MWIILGIFISYSALALEPFEKIKGVKILKALPGNIVMLNRGLEDGLQRNDHIKISSETQGYNSRAICLKTSRESSYWKLYRIPYSEVFSQDLTYTISGLADREIPLPHSELRDLEHEFKEPKKKTAAGADPDDDDDDDDDIGATTGATTGKTTGKTADIGATTGETAGKTAGKTADIGADPGADPDADADDAGADINFHAAKRCTSSSCPFVSDTPVTSFTAATVALNVAPNISWQNTIDDNIMIPF